MIDITQVIVSLFGLLAAVFAITLFPYIKTKITAEQWKYLQNIAYVAVNAAEQLGITGKIEEKFDYAKEQIKKMLEKSRLTYDEDAVRAAIEAAVRQNFPK